MRFKTEAKIVFTATPMLGWIKRASWNPQDARRRSRELPRCSQEAPSGLPGGLLRAFWSLVERLGGVRGGRGPLFRSFFSSCLVLFFCVILVSFLVPLGSLLGSIWEHFGVQIGSKSLLDASCFPKRRF